MSDGRDRLPSKAEARLRSRLTEKVEFSPEGHAVDEFVLRHGTFYPRGFLPRGFKRGESKACFMNAALAVFDQEGDDIEYAEGFALSVTQSLPFAHAWCVKDGRAIEVTLPGVAQYYYLGISVTKSDLIHLIERQRHYGLLGGENFKEFMSRYENLKAAKD